MVNIKDFKIDHDKIKEKYSHLVDLPDNNIGMLSIIFERQKELMEKYANIELRNHAIVPSAEKHGDLDDRQIQIRIKDMMWRCVEELGEAANTLKNKPWKDDAKFTDKEHFYEEIADAFHFFVEMCIVSGIGPSDLFNLYFLKSEVNKFRQRSGY